MARILIIEDDADIALSLKHNLERDGDHLVVLAADGVEGLRAALGPPAEERIETVVGVGYRWKRPS